MDKKRIQEILNMFPAQKPIAFNYVTGRAAVLELIAMLQSGGKKSATMSEEAQRRQ